MWTLIKTRCTFPATEADSMVKQTTCQLYTCVGKSGELNDIERTIVVLSADMPVAEQRVTLLETAGKVRG